MHEGKALYIKFNWISDDVNLIAKANELENLMLSEHSRKPKKDFTSAFNVLLSSFDVQGVYSGWDLYIPTNNNLYSGITRRDAVYTNEMLKCLKWLIKSGYLIKEAGRSSTVKKHVIKHFPFRYSISPKLSSSPLSNPKLIRRNPLCGYVQLRDDFKDSKRVVNQSRDVTAGHETMIDFTDDLLKQYDIMMSGVEITLGSKPVHSSITSMTRIFSKGSFNQGGRLYSSIQSLKKEARKYIRFNNEPTVEIDYSAIHPVMLYNIEGIDFAGDPYQIDGFPRDTVKVAFNIMLNRKGSLKSKAAVQALVNELEITTQEALLLQNAIINKHKVISKHFNTGYGLNLQKRDSELAMQLISLFVGNNRPIMTIHDSAIVSVRDVEQLHFAMNECFARMFKMNTSIQPTLKIKHLDFSEPLLKIMLRFFEEGSEVVYHEKDALDRLIENEPIKEVPRVYQVSSFTIQEVDEELL